MLLCHRPIRRLRTALFEGVQQKPSLVLSRLPEPRPMPACCVLAQDLLLAASKFSQRCSELRSRHRVRIWRRSSRKETRPEMAHITSLLHV
jgi:hypothetical protein